MKIVVYLLLLLYSPRLLNAQNQEFLGEPLKVSNVQWLIHPNNDGANGRENPWYVKKKNGHTVSILYDLKNLNDNAMPTERFSLITVNTDSGYYKRVSFTPKTGTVQPVSFGRPWKHFEGPDKKVYFSTADGGGQFLQYNIETETAKDLGSPFTIVRPNKVDVFGVYSLTIGSDSAIYGGSFSNGKGDTYTFRYEPKTDKFWKSDFANPIDTSLQYVSYVSGDAECNYVVCGQSTWRLYAIKRSTNGKVLLAESSDRIYGFVTTPCGVYTRLGSTWYKLSATSKTETVEPPATTCPTIDYTFYNESDTTLPKTYWDPVSTTYYFQPKNDTLHSLTIAGVVKYPRTIGFLANFKDSIIVGNGMLYNYTLDYKPTVPGLPKLVGDNNAYSVHGLLSANNKVYMSAYPNGVLEEWDPSKPWTLGTATLTYTPPPFTSPLSNARKAAIYRVDGEGPHELHLAGATEDGYVVVAGNNIRTDTSLCFGRYKNGDSTRLINAQRFKDYRYIAATISFSKKTAYVLGGKMDAGNKKYVSNIIFEYDPVSNNIVDSFPLFTTSVERLGDILVLPNEELFGSYSDSGKKYLYTFDLISRKITWRGSFEVGARDYFFRLGPDEQVWIPTVVVGTSVPTFTFKKFDPYTKEITSGPTLTNPDKGGARTVYDLLFWKKDLYIGGFTNLIRFRNVVQPLPANIRPEDKVQWVFNTHQKPNTSCN